MNVFHVFLELSYDILSFPICNKITFKSIIIASQSGHTWLENPFTYKSQVGMSAQVQILRNAGMNLCDIVLETGIDRIISTGLKSGKPAMADDLKLVKKH